MNRVLSFLLIFHWVVAEALNHSGRSYYFKLVGNNEFSVFNRIQFLNHNISDYSANPHPPMNVQIPVNHKQTTKITKLKKFYLDEEWDYEHKPQNKSELPYFIRKFYEDRLKQPHNNDILRIFFNTNRNTSSRIIKFDLGSLRADENITDADMYFYWPLDNSSSIFKTSVVLRLYQFEKQFTNDLNESVLAENPDVHKLFNVIYISKAQKGWQTFKIKKPLSNWANGEDNLGLLLTISSYEENKLISVYNDTNTGVFRTFAVLSIQKNGTRVNSTQIVNSTEIGSASKSTNSNNCFKKSWSLNFEDLHWNNVILYPENGVEVNQCTGKCQWNSHMNNHAKLRQFLNNGHQVCCVPVQFSSFPVMFVDVSGNVVLKNYDDFVVQDCGCR